MVSHSLQPPSQPPPFPGATPGCRPTACWHPARGPQTVPTAELLRQCGLWCALLPPVRGAASQDLENAPRFVDRPCHSQTWASKDAPPLFMDLIVPRNTPMVWPTGRPPLPGRGMREWGQTRLRVHQALEGRQGGLAAGSCQSDSDPWVPGSGRGLREP